MSDVKGRLNYHWEIKQSFLPSGLNSLRIIWAFWSPSKGNLPVVACK